MSGWVIGLMVYIGIQALLLTWRVASGEPRSYSLWDLILGLPEYAFVAWIIVVKA